MIELIQGTPGSGKSAVALATGLDHLMSGGVLATNFNLVEDWAWKLAGVNIWAKIGFKSRKKLAASYESRCWKIGKPSTVFELSKIYPEYLSNSWKRKREGKALLILDEAQLYFNSRNWSKNFEWIEFFTQHRKLGWDVLLVAHYKEMIDKQILPLIEVESRFRNLKKIRLPFLPIPLSPFNLFLIIKYYSGYGPGVGMVHSRQIQPLYKTFANLYDSFEVFAFDSLPDEITRHGKIKEKAIDMEEKKEAAKPTIRSSKKRQWGSVHEILQ